MSASTPLSPFILARQKPQAKSLSPVSRNLFGQSSAAEVTHMLNEVFMSEKQKAKSKLNFDICNERPMKHQQQENITDVDRTPESRRRYAWKVLKPGEVPEFYSRRYKGKKNLMPVDLLNCSPDPADSRSRSVRRSLNGYLRTPSKELEKNFSSASRLQDSPLRTLSPQRIIDSPASFDESVNPRITAPVLRPLAVHASKVNALTAKVFTPSKSVLVRPVLRSPLSERENQSRSARALDFSCTPKKLPLVKTAKRVTESNITGSMTQGITFTPTADKQSTPSLTTPRAFAPPAMKQLKLTDMATMKKSRSPTLKARKRLNLSGDSLSSVPSTKTPRLTHGGN